VTAVIIQSLGIILYLAGSNGRFCLRFSVRVAIRSAKRRYARGYRRHGFHTLQFSALPQVHEVGETEFVSR